MITRALSRLQLDRPKRISLHSQSSRAYLPCILSLPECYYTFNVLLRFLHSSLHWPRLKIQVGLNVYNWTIPLVGFFYFSYSIIETILRHRSLVFPSLMLSFWDMVPSTSPTGIKEGKGLRILSTWKEKWLWEKSILRVCTGFCPVILS